MRKRYNQLSDADPTGDDDDEKAQSDVTELTVEGEAKRQRSLLSATELQQAVKRRELKIAHDRALRVRLAERALGRNTKTYGTQTPSQQEECKRLVALLQVYFEKLQPRGHNRPVSLPMMCVFHCLYLLTSCMPCSACG